MEPEATVVKEDHQEIPCAFIFIYPGLAYLPHSQEHEFWKKENQDLNLGCTTN